MKLVLLLLLLLAGLFLEELYRYVFYRGSSALFTRLFDTRGHEERYYQKRDEAAARFRALPHEEYTITSADGCQLKGFYYPCGSGGKTVVFIIHGYRSEHGETAGFFYDYYQSRGIDIFCCDHTASGESGGTWIGFDVLESRDCLQWIDVLRQKFGDDIKIILHGFSMGGATVLQMSGHCPEQVRAIVADSAYRNAKASMDHQIGPLYHPLRLLNRLIAGYDWNDSDVTESMAASRIPILFVHGRDDKLVPFENGPMLYESYRGEKDCLFPAGTRHIESIYTVPEEYEKKLDHVLSKYLPDHMQEAEP